MPAHLSPTLSCSKATNVALFDFVAGPDASDLSLADALTQADTLAQSSGRGVIIGLKPGDRAGNYLFDELDIAPGVNLFGASPEVVRLDGQFNFSGAGRRELRNISILQSTDKRCLNIAPSGFSVILVRGGTYQSNSGASAVAVVEVGTASGVFIASQAEFLALTGNPEPVIKQLAGTVSIQNNCLVSPFDYTTPALTISSGSTFIRRSEIFNPISLLGGSMLMEFVEWDAFQLSPLAGTALTMDGGAFATLRSVKVVQADGQTAPVFDNAGGGGTVFHDMMSVEHFEFTGAGTLFAVGITETRLRERSGTAIP